jgi:magnesium-transporting ATPase (P-type)
VTRLNLHWKFSQRRWIFLKKGNFCFLNETRLQNSYEFVSEMPFDSDIKIMTVIYAKESEKNNLVYLTKGSVERVLGNCVGYVGNDGNSFPMTPGNFWFVFMSIRVRKESRRNDVANDKQRYESAGSSL